MRNQVYKPLIHHSGSAPLLNPRIGSMIADHSSHGHSRLRTLPAR